MHKVKVFKFEVSNWAAGPLVKDVGEKSYRAAYDRIDSPLVIENTINSFLEDKFLLSITVNKVETHYHNNGRGNLIHLFYTILYMDKEGNNAID